MLCYAYFVKSIFIIFLKFQVVEQSLNSPKFENLLLGDDLCSVFLRWRCMLKSNRDSMNVIMSIIKANSVLV